MSKWTKSTCLHFWTIGATFSFISNNVRQLQMCAVAELLAHCWHRWGAQPPLALFLPLPCTPAKHSAFKTQLGTTRGFWNCWRTCHCEAPRGASWSGPACCAIALDTCSSTCACRMLSREVMTNLWPNLGTPVKLGHTFEVIGLPPCDVPNYHSKPSLLAYKTPKQSRTYPWH